MIAELLGTLIIYLACPALQPVELMPAAHLEPGTVMTDAFAAYYDETPALSYGYATRYGSDAIAIRELRWSAIEARYQDARGYILLGGGYGYRYIGGGRESYLLENRASEGYAIAADRQMAEHTDNQQVLLSLATMSAEAFDEYVNERYVGVASLHSPNDIGREACLIRLDTGEPVGLVIVGGTAARNDWTYFGPSKNDDYGHERLGVRISQHDSRDYYWLADLSDSAYNAAGGNGGPVFIGLAPAMYCECN